MITYTMATSPVEPLLESLDMTTRSFRSSHAEAADYGYEGRIFIEDGELVIEFAARDYFSNLEAPHVVGRYFPYREELVVEDLHEPGGLTTFQRFHNALGCVTLITAKAYGDLVKG